MLEKIYDWLLIYGTKFIIAVILLLIGLKLIKLLTVRINYRLDKSRIDPSLKSFISPLISIILKVILLITLIGMFGIEMTSFIAILASLGFAIGLALQGSLANFAGGILILILKPYRVGDFIETLDFSGTVKDIHIFHTVLSTTDNKRVLIPNASLADAIIINYSVNDIRRLELKLSCSYENDVLYVKEVFEEYINKHPNILKEPKSSVNLSEYGDSSINFTIRAWVKANEYWSTYYDLLLNIQKLYQKAGIKKTYNKLDVHIKETGE